MPSTASSICTAAASADSWSGSSSHARTSRRWASSWLAEPVLDGAQRAVSSIRRATASAGTSCDRLEQRVPAGLELAERALRGGQRDPDVDLTRVVVGGQQAQRGLATSARRRRRARGVAAPGREQQRDRRLVARAAPALLDVVGALGRARAAAPPACSAARACAPSRQPPGVAS